MNKFVEMFKRNRKKSFEDSFDISLNMIMCNLKT